MALMNVEMAVMNRHPALITLGLFTEHFGFSSGMIILIFGIISAIVATIIVCAYNRSCPLYKWRKRKEQPPVGVIVAEPNQLYEDQPGDMHYT